MARSSPDYDSSIQLEGVSGEIPVAPGGGREEATLAVLRPDQKQAYLDERQRRREAAEKDMQSIGLTLPSNWNFLDP